MNVGLTWYEVFARKSKRKCFEQFGIYPESKWQLALKHRRALAEKGLCDAHVREVRVTRVWT